MNRFVYLFELDSVRNSPAELEAGQNALFEEIVKNGNIVVLTFNQLSDSEAFLCAVKDEAVFEHILPLFSAGVLKVSQYGTIRTASQYIQNSIEKCINASSDSFLFSGLPVRSTETELLKTLLNVLKYSDLGLLEQLLERERDPTQRGRLEYISRFMRMILLLSVEQPAGHPAKAEQSLGFTGWMEKIIPVLREFSRWRHILPESADGCAAQLEELLPETLALLDDVSAALDSESLRNHRTNWVTMIGNCPSSDQQRLAEAVIDLCYNYTVESSIYQISCHYSPDAADSFPQDLVRRLALYWEQSRTNIHQFCVGDRDEVIDCHVSFPPWDTAVRIAQAKRGGAVQSPARYEDSYCAERRKWNRELIWQMLRRFGTGFLYIVLFCVVDGLVNKGQDILGGLFELLEQGNPIPELLQLVCSSILFGLLSSNVANLLHLPDILESIDAIKTGIGDICRIARWPDGSAYRQIRSKEERQ